MPNKVQGTEDLHGSYMRAWERMQQAAADVFGAYGFSRVETPALEQLDVFVHGIGESTDVVRKEMFRVMSGSVLEQVFEAGGESRLKPRQRLALRPEGTASVVRMVVEDNLVPQGGAPVKYWYGMPMFRGERPQKGRLRQFHQIGLEWIGADDPAADAETIIMLMDFYAALGLPRENLLLKINSMGDNACRPAYRESVREYILAHADGMCSDCLERAQTNPLRAFDCKNPGCKAIMAGAPLIPGALCDDCRSHYERVKRYLDAAGIAYEEDPMLVRGLDYYTRTVFEVETTDGNEAGSLGGGGRYDGLVEIEGGRPTPGIGFAVGFERICIALAKAGVELGGEEPPCIYIACAAPECREAVFSCALELRRAGFRVEADYQGRSLKSQFKQADRLKATSCIIIGPDELESGEYTVRDMLTHEQRNVPSADLLEQLTKA
ncbi:MAG: histidine--tRNA ligase [Atopobiaceae bacterium]|nr:histidine--tRNA ligase [Atopobiaceae bacterium]